MFSMFDPSSYFSNLPWFIVGTPLMILVAKKTPSQSKMSKIISKLMTMFDSEMVQLMSNQKNKHTLTMSSKMFISLTALNAVALLPFNFTTMAHISISSTLSLTIWISTLTFGWMNQLKSMMAHLTPLGTPNALMNFMVLIEMVSNIIRPITLSIRMTANMVAGHLLMSLLSSFSMKSWGHMLLSSMANMVLTTLELMVAVIQAYVFITLLTLYQNESMK